MSLLREQLDLATAVSAHVSDGDCVYLGNFGSQLFAVGHELIRQNRQGLHIIMGSAGLLLDQLIGAGVVAEATFAHCWNPIGPAPTWNFRRMAESGSSDVKLHEVTFAMLNGALQAGAWGVPFMPVVMAPGTGYVTDDWSKGGMANASSPFGDCNVMRALVPDVAFVHADWVDQLGNAVIEGPVGESVVAAQSARTSVIIAEALGTVQEIRNLNPSLPGLYVSAIAVVKGSARPDGTLHGYPRDVGQYEEYTRMTATEDGFAQWLKQLRSTQDMTA